MVAMLQGMKGLLQDLPSRVASPVLIPLGKGALPCVVLRPLLKFQRCVTRSRTFLLPKHFLASPHAGFVELCSW